MLKTTFLVPGAVAQAVQAAQDYSWAAHITAGAGTYDGQQRRIISGVGNVDFWLEWDSADSLWYPAGGKALYYVGAKQTDATATTQAITFPTVAHPANFWRSGLGMEVDFMAEDSATATARTLVMTLGSTNFVELPTAANRRAGGLYGWVADGAATQWSYIKKDSASFSPYESGNSNLTLMTEDLTTALNFTGSVTVTAAGTLTKRRLKLYLVRG